MRRSEILIVAAALTAPIIVFLLIFMPGALPGLVAFVTAPDIAPFASTAAVIVLAGILVIRRLPRRRPPPGLAGSDTDKPTLGSLLRPPKRDVEDWRNDDWRNQK